MQPVAAVLVVLALLATATLAGVVWRARTGRARTAHEGAIAPADLGVERFGERATFVQFSTEYCSPCRAAHTMLDALAAERDGVEHLDVDLTARPELAGRFRILQTPTVLLIDGAGTVRTRIGGAPRRHEVIAVVDDLLRENSVGV